MSRVILHPSKLSIHALAFVLWASSFQAASAGTLPAAVEGVLTLDVATATTYDDAVPASGVTKIVKKGVGEAVLTQASTFDGTVEIEDGVLTLAHKQAVGARSPVTVKPGATLKFTCPCEGQSANHFLDHPVTMGGTGYDNQGAIVWAPASYTTSTMFTDALLKYVTLTDDTLVKGSQRWGIKGGACNLGGHTLTKDGTFQLMLSDSVVLSNGTIKIVRGYITPQGVVRFHGSATDRLEVYSPGYIYTWAWNTEARVDWTLAFYDGGAYKVGGSSTGANINNLTGPIEVTGTVTFEQSEAGDINIRGKISGTGKLVKTGTKYLHLHNTANDWTGGLEVKNGYLVATEPGVLPGRDVAGRYKVTKGHLCLPVVTPSAGHTVTWTVQDVMAAEETFSATHDGYLTVKTSQASDVFTIADEQQGNLAHVGPGTVTAAGNVTGRASMLGEGGRWVWSGAARAVSNLYVNAGTVAQTAGETTAFKDSFYLRAAGGVLFDLLGGSYTRTAPATGVHLATTSNQDGMMRLGPGTTFLPNQYVYVAPFVTNNYAVLDIQAATVRVDMASSGVYVGGNGRGSHGIVRVRDGGVFENVANGSSCRFAQNHAEGTFYDGARSVVTVDGSNSVIHTGCYIMCDNNRSNNVSILNLTRGGTLSAFRFYEHPYCTNGLSYVNCDGGVMKMLWGYGWNHVGAGLHYKDPDRITLFKGGLVIDTTACGTDGTVVQGHANGVMTPRLSAPSGKGIARVTLPTSDAFKAERYVMTPRMTITGAGWGQSVYAELDFTTHAPTGVTVMSCGCDCDDTTAVKIWSADRKRSYDCTVTLADNDCTSGGLTVRAVSGSPLHLDNPANSYRGPTRVESGRLVAYVAGAVPTNSAVYICAGASLGLQWGHRTIGALGGAGSTEDANNGSTVLTLTQGLALAAEDVLDGQYVTVKGALVKFVGTPAVAVDDPAALGALDRRVCVLKADYAIQGIDVTKPNLGFTMPAPEYCLTASTDLKKLYIHRSCGTILLFR